MRLLHIALTLAWLALAPDALAQFVKGNEAVKVAGGSKKVETPPVGNALLAKPCPAANPACSGGGWKMVETSEGLMECTEVYARPTTCRKSTYGSEKLPRVWVVKLSDAWQQCQLPDIAKSCVPLKSLQTTVVQ
ncbi:MAG: hypothetical protein KIT60_03525 [Burkholderiaceae bacterium]|nr:hypothetical protein [Burkholderiaceae bacterium]